MLPRRPRTRRNNVTLRDVAKLAGVSPKTVSNVVNDWPYITDETRQKVQKAIDELGYRPSGLATSLRTGQTKNIGVVIPDITNPFFGQVVRGCEDILYSAGYNIYLCNTGEDPAKERKHLDMLINRGVDGLLLFGSRSDNEVLAALVDDSIPIVAEDSPSQHDNTTVIEIDNRGGTRLAVQHLVAGGHKQVGYLSGPLGRQAAETRLEGYTSALEESGIAFDSALVYRCAPSIRGGYIAAMQILQKQQPTALVCYNDLMAVGAMVACRQLNLDVPTDIAIVGFDDIALATLVSPALTTIRVRQYDMGRLASELLLERLHGKESPKDHVLYPVELIVRGSSGTQRSNRKQADQTLDYLLNLDFVDPVQCGPDE